MAKSTSKSLFNLIHSLNRSEKRYFKLYADNNTIGGHNHYLLLFDAITRQKEYKEEALKQMFKYSIKNFKATKYQLYRLILNSLNAFYKHQTELSKVLLNIHSIEILEKKNLYKESLQLVQKTKKIAVDNQLDNYLEELEVKESDILDSMKGLKSSTRRSEPKEEWTDPAEPGKNFSES